MKRFKVTTLMFKRVKIIVTKNNIKNGIRGNPLQCPIAKALRRKTNTIYSVTPSLIRLWSQPEKYCLTPKKVFKFIRKFDNRKKVNPFSFCIKLPQ